VRGAERKKEKKGKIGLKEVPRETDIVRKNREAKEKKGGGGGGGEKNKK